MIRNGKFKGKCIFSLVLVLTMAVNLSILVRAQELEEGNMDVISNVEENVNTDIYQVVVPTDIDEVFNFILDPQGLINATDGAAYEGKTFEKDSTLFFRRTDGMAEVDYSNKSDFVTITNKGSVPVDVSVEVWVEESSIEGISMTDDREFTDDKRASLYLAITDGENEVPVGKEGAFVHETVDGALSEAYDFYEYSFQLTGAVNREGDWTALGNVSPKIVVTWRVTESVKEKDRYTTGNNEVENLDNTEKNSSSAEKIDEEEIFDENNENQDLDEESESKGQVKKEDENDDNKVKKDDEETHMN